MKRLSTAIALSIALLTLGWSIETKAQPTPGGSCNPSATCWAYRLALRAGRELCLNYPTCTADMAYSSTAGVVLSSPVTNTGSNVAFTLAATNALTTGARKYISVTKGGTEIAYLDANPTLYVNGQINSETRVFAPYFANLTTAQPVTLWNFAANDGTGVAAVIRTDVAWTVAGAKLASFRNLTTEKAYVDMDGKIGINTTDDRATCGSRTVNTPSGKSSVCNGASTLTITNSTVTAASMCYAQLAETDAGCLYVKSVIPAAGSFAITVSANCTNATSTDVAWVCFN